MQQRWNRAYKSVPITVLIVVLNTAIYLLTALQSRSLEHNLQDSSLAFDWIMYGPAVTQGQWYRLLTSSLLHFGIGHLLMNMLLFVFLAAHLERVLGSAAFLCSYLVCALGSGVSIYVFDPRAYTAGASGAIYGLMALLVVQAIYAKTDVRAPLTLLLVNIGYSFLLSGVSVAGHFGGMITGLVLAYPLLRGNRNQRGVVLIVVTLVLAGAAYVTAQGLV